MSDILYDSGLSEMRDDWDTGTFLWILAQNAYVPNRATHQFIDDITNEVSVASYARIAPDTPTITPDTTNHLLAYSCVDPDFGVLEDTQDARWLILARDVTNDADSPLIAAFDLGGTGVNCGNDGNAFVVHLHPDGFYIDRQVPA